MRPVLLAFGFIFWLRAGSSFPTSQATGIQRGAMAPCRDTHAQALQMTRARAKAMLMELLVEYSSKQFQSKLGDILQKEAEQGEVPDDLPGRWVLAEECHADVFARYGFKSGTGTERLRPIVLIFQKFPDLEDKVRKLWKLLGLKSSPQDLLDKEESSEVPLPEAPEPAKIQKPSLSKSRALAYQAELHGAFSAPCFQKKLAELSRKHVNSWHDAEGRVAWSALALALCLAV